MRKGVFRVEEGIANANRQRHEWATGEMFSVTWQTRGEKQWTRMLERKVAAGHDAFHRHLHTCWALHREPSGAPGWCLTYSLCPENVYSIAGDREVIKNLQRHMLSTMIKICTDQGPTKQINVCILPIIYSYLSTKYLLGAYYYVRHWVY